MGQDKGSLMKKSKNCAQKQSKKKVLFSTSHQQVMSSCFLGSRASVHIVVASEDKHLNSECPPLPLSWYRWAQCHMAWTIPLIGLGPSLLPVPSLLASGDKGGWRGGLDAVPTLLSSSQNTGVLW